MAGNFKPGYEQWRATQVPDGGGGFEIVYAKIADVVGRAYPTRSVEAIEAGTRADIISWIFACPGDLDIRQDDQIRFDGRVLRVQAVPVTSTGRRQEAVCEEG